MHFQDIILTLQNYWAKQGCIIQQPVDIEVGAGTFNCATFLRSLGPEPWNTAYVQPSRRPKDGRYGENPNRVYIHHQFQVILKPAPSDIQKLYLGSLYELGINPLEHDIRFVEDDWESPSLGAWGLGWEVWLNGMEITQFTYFQQIGGLELHVIPVELTYGLERIALYLQNKTSIYDLTWTDGILYGEVRKHDEYEYSKYSFELSNVEMLRNSFNEYEKEANVILNEGLIMPAYDYVMKCSHVFNLLDARGVISVTERTSYIKRVRDLARKCAQIYCEVREKIGYPLLKGQEV